jgi:hypothetical protein
MIRLIVVGLVVLAACGGSPGVEHDEDAGTDSSTVEQEIKNIQNELEHGCGVYRGDAGLRFECPDGWAGDS